MLYFWNWKNIFLWFSQTGGDFECKCKKNLYICLTMVVGRSPSSFSLIWPLRYTEPRTNRPNWNRKLLCLLPILESCLIRTSKSYFKRSFSLTFPRYSEGTAAESTRLLYPRRCASFWQRVCVTSSWQLRGSDLWLHYEGITFFWADVKNSSWGSSSSATAAAHVHYLFWKHLLVPSHIYDSRYTVHFRPRAST